MNASKVVRTHEQDEHMSMELKTKPIRAPSAATMVAEALRAGILKGEFKAGVRLMQDAVAGQFGVSQSVVREAFTQLATEGFLRADPRRGVSVSELSSEDAAELIRLRSAVEVQALEAAIPRLTATDLLKARTAIETLESAKSAAEVIEWNAEFHDALYQPSGLVRTLALVDVLRSNFDRYFRFVYDQTGHVPKTHAEHRKLLRLCEARDVGAACDLLREHIVGTGEALTHQLSKTGKSAG